LICPSPYFHLHLYLHPFPTRRSSDLCICRSPATASSRAVLFENVTEIQAKSPSLWAPKVSSTSFSRLPMRFASGPAFCWKIGAKDRKSTRLNSSHQIISYAVFCLKKK